MKLTPSTTALIRSHIENRQPVFIGGHTGIGKTSIYKQIARDIGGRAFVVSCNLLAGRDDLVAPRTRSDNAGGYEQYFVPHYRIAEAVKYANEHPEQTVVVILDEINRVADPGVTSAALSIQTERELGDVQLSENIVVVSTGNITGNIIDFDPASTSRFAIVNLEPDAITWLNWMGTDRVHPLIAQLLTEHPHMVYEEGVSPTLEASRRAELEGDDDPSLNRIQRVVPRTREILQLTCPRTLEALNTYLNATDNDMLRDMFFEASELKTATGELRGISFLHEIIESLTGNTSFTLNLVNEFGKEFDPPVTPRIAGMGDPAVRTPAVDAILEAPTIAEVEEVAEECTLIERSELLLWLLESPDDRTQMIQTVVAAFPDGEGVVSDIRTSIGQRAAIGLLNLDNVRAAVQVPSSDVADALRVQVEAVLNEDL